MSEWETVIGLEVHARLNTKTKAFCGCPNQFGAEPNTLVCPVCLALPGALPVLNSSVVELATRMALATDCVIHHESVFARKNYFYPDLPKGYQISQFDRPIATEGFVDSVVDGGPKRIGVTRIHIEEDAGKLIHDPAVAGDDSSLVDLNRAGVPLIEIVSEPDCRSAGEAVAYLNRLRQILIYTDVCDGNMEEGSLRCDANVSVRRKGEPLGTRAEVKNLNSFRFLAKAIEYEVERQIELIESGGTVVQETRLFDPSRGETRSMRSKEEAHDYRYFPEPDLPPLRIDEDWIEKQADLIPELPGARYLRYREMGLDDETAETFAASRSISDFVDESMSVSKSGKTDQIANWIKNEVLRTLNENNIEPGSLAFTAGELTELVDLIESGTISGKIAKTVYAEMEKSGGSPASIVEEKGLAQISDPDQIREIVDAVIESSAPQVEQYRSGKEAIFGFLMGQVMKQSRGRVNPDAARDILLEQLKS